MVHEIIKTKYRIFLETLVFTLLIVSIGFFMGYLVEYGRIANVAKDYKNFEVSALDLRLQNYYYQIMDQAFCDKSIEQNFIFADDIYNEGLIIQKYENANKLSEDILLEKKRYVLLKTELWLNSILLKEKCNNPFHTVVYAYSQTDDLIKGAEQRSISETLREIKEDRGNEIILIPIAGDLGLDIVDLQLNVYNVTYLPSVIIDEETILKGYHPLSEIEKYLD